MGRVSMGVRSIDLSEGDQVISLGIVEEGMRVLAITSLGYGKQDGCGGLPRTVPRRQGHHGHAFDGEDGPYSRRSIWCARVWI